MSPINEESFDRANSTSTPPRASETARVHSQADEKNGYIYTEKSLPQVHVSSESRSSVHSSSRRRRPVILSWWQEATACIVAIAVFFALFATLYAFNKKPDNKTSHSISFNTILSLYTKVFGAAIGLIAVNGLGQLKWAWLANGEEKPIRVFMDYDGAIGGSRKGALTLLWKLRLSHPVSSAGIMILLLIAAIDPLAQQLVERKDCVTPIQNSGTLPRTNYYTLPRARGGAHSGSISRTVDVGLQNVINSALYNPDLTSSVDCQSGNCTWAEEYSTVGYCRSCKDVTDQLAFTQTSFLDSYGMVITNYTTTLPNVGVSMLDDANAKATAAMGSSDPTQSDGLATLDFILAKNYNGSVDPATGEPWTDCNNPSTNSTWKCQGYGASRCNLFPCVKTYTARSESNKLVETLQSTASVWGTMNNQDMASVIPWAMLDSKCIDDGERKTLSDLGYVFDNKTRWMPYNLTNLPYASSLEGAFPSSMIKKNCVYMIDLESVFSLSGYLNLYFTGNVASDSMGTQKSFGQFTGPQSIQAIYNFGEVSFDRVDEFLNNITTVLTNAIRQSGVQDFTSPAQGVMDRTEICIEVKWPYLAFPAAMTVFAIVFFVSMLVKTRTNGDDGPEIWKASTMPLLYRSMHLPREGREVRDVERRKDGVVELREMEEVFEKGTITFEGLMRDGGERERGEEDKWSVG